MNIYIDVGHGGTDATGTDTGASGVYNDVSYKESECNLTIALAAKSIISNAGHLVKLSRESDVNLGGLVGSYGRADSNLINSANACKAGTYDFMISIHNNSSSNKSASGYQLIYKTGDGKEEESLKLANILGKYLDKSIPKNAIYKSVAKNGKDNHGILRLHDKIGVLIEGLFMSNASDMALLSDESKLKDMGAQIGYAVVEYAGGNISELKNIEDAYKTLSEKYGILEQMYSTLKKSYELKSSEYSNISSHLSSVTKEKDTLSANNSKLTTEISEYKKKISTLENTITENSNYISSLSESNKKLAVEITTVKNENSKLSKQIDNLATKYEKQLVKGDVNGDGSVDITDAVILLRHLINPKKYPL